MLILAMKVKHKRNNYKKANRIKKFPDTSCLKIRITVKFIKNVIIILINICSLNKSQNNCFKMKLLKINY